MRERLIGKPIESCTLGALQARSEEHLKHPDRHSSVPNTRKGEVSEKPVHVVQCVWRGILRKYPKHIVAAIAGADEIR